MTPEHELAFAVNNLRRLKEEKRNAMKAHNEEIDRAQMIVDALASDIESGQKTIQDLIDSTGLEKRINENLPPGVEKVTVTARKS